MFLGKILVVDDDEKILRLVEIELTAAKYEVILCSNAAEAIEKAKTVLPGLILMDVMLPDMNGAEVATAIKSIPETENIPIIFLTGMVTKTNENQSFAEINVSGHMQKAIIKPINSKDLLTEVNKVFGRNEQ